MQAGWCEICIGCKAQASNSLLVKIGFVIFSLWNSMGTYQFELLCCQMAHPADPALALEPMGITQHVQENIIKQKRPVKFTMLMTIPLLQI